MVEYTYWAKVSYYTRIVVDVPEHAYEEADELAQSRFLRILKTVPSNIFGARAAQVVKAELADYDGELIWEMHKNEEDDWE